jgi:hypothetical protein
MAFGIDSYLLKMFKLTRTINIFFIINLYFIINFLRVDGSELNYFLIETDSINLEENNDNYIDNITDIFFNPSGNKFSICQLNGFGRILIYNINGKIDYTNDINNSNQYDSVSVKKENGVFGYKINEFFYPFPKLLENDTVVKFNKTIYFTRFVNDTTVICLGSMSIEVDRKENQNLKKINRNITIMIIASTNNANRYKLIPLKPYKDYFPQRHYFDFKNNEFLVPIRTNDNSSLSNDKKVVLAKYDTIGNFIEPFIKLPEEYIKSGAEFKLQYSPYLTENCKFAMFPYINKIFNIDKNNYITIDSLLSPLSDLENYSHARQNWIDCFPIRYSNIGLRNENEFIIYAIKYKKGEKDNEINSEPKIFLYSLLTKKLHNIEICNSTEIKYIKYIEALNKVVISYIDNDLWIIKSYDLIKNE